MPNKLLFILSFTATVLVSCGSQQERKQLPKTENAIPDVFVSNYPLEYFTQRIGGNTINLLRNYREVEDPTLWEPGETDINALQNADLVLLNGASFEPWAMMLSLPQSRLVVTMATAEDQLIEEQQTTSHSHGPEGEHEHAVLAYTTWLDFQLSRTQAKSVFNALSRLQPEQTEYYLANFKELDNQLAALDETMRSVAQSWQETQLAFSHPVYQYPASSIWP